MNATQRKASLEAKISQMCDCQVEITVRGEKSFTLSAIGDKDLGNAVRFLSLSGRIENLSREYDAECDQTCVWFDVV